MRRLSRVWLMGVLVLCLGAGPWAHALVTSAAAPPAGHCASHESTSTQSSPLQITDCCKVDAGGCSCTAASAFATLPVHVSFHDAGFSPVAFTVEPHSTEPSGVFRPPI